MKTLEKWRRRSAIKARGADIAPIIYCEECSYWGGRSRQKNLRFAMPSGQCLNPNRDVRETLTKAHDGCRIGKREEVEDGTTGPRVA